MIKRLLSMLFAVLTITSALPVLATGEDSGTLSPEHVLYVNTIEELNKEFRTAVKAESYIVFVSPSRASGWETLRWAPTTASEVIATYGAREELRVIKELNDWLQVEDLNTGDVGFIRKNAVTRKSAN